MDTSWQTGVNEELKSVSLHKSQKLQFPCYVNGPLLLPKHLLQNQQPLRCIPKRLLRRPKLQPQFLIPALHVSHLDFGRHLVVIFRQPSGQFRDGFETVDR
jgi:hypothetical protein